MTLATNIILDKIDIKKLDERNVKEYIAKQNTDIDNMSEKDINIIYNSLIK
jgi:hypothetical protein